MDFFIGGVVIFVIGAAAGVLYERRGWAKATGVYRASQVGKKSATTGGGRLPKDRQK